MPAPAYHSAVGDFARRGQRQHKLAARCVDSVHTRRWAPGGCALGSGHAETTQRPRSTVVARNAGEPDYLAKAREEAKENASREANMYVSGLVDTDRTFELLSWVWSSLTKKKEPKAAAPPSHGDETDQGQNARQPPAATEVAVFGGGCFWCVEACFQMVRGVIKVESGYAAGSTAFPTYFEVCSGETGHAEVVRVTYNPTQITYKQLLDMFFAAHDPTQLNRQGDDIGTQYRSIILYQDADQLIAARDALKAAREASLQPVVTQLVELEAFYPADEYHQQYYLKNPTGAYCRKVVRPKVRDFQDRFRDRLYK